MMKQTESRLAMKRAIPSLRFVIPSLLFLGTFAVWAVSSWGVNFSRKASQTWFNNTHVGLMTLFTGLGAAGLVYTLYLQVKTAHAERVGQRFDRLMTAWREGVPDDTSMLVNWEHKLLKDCLGVDETTERSPKSRNEVAVAFDKFYEDYVGAELGYVFRIYNDILTLIDESNILNELEKNDLLRAFKSLLSDVELHFIVYLGLSNFVPPRFKELVEKYDILEGLTTKPFRKTVSNAKSQPIVIRTAARIAEITYYDETWKRWKIWNKVRRSDSDHGVTET